MVRKGIFRFFLLKLAPKRDFWEKIIIKNQIFQAQLDPPLAIFGAMVGYEYQII